jgi:hypothetical protein
MPERDILSLLALGTTDRSLTTTVGGGQQGTGAGQQLISGVANQALKGVTKNLGVDVQLSPGFDDTNEAYQKVVIKIPVNRKLELSGSQTLGKKPETEARTSIPIYRSRFQAFFRGQVVKTVERFLTRQWPTVLEILKRPASTSSTNLSSNSGYVWPFFGSPTFICSQPHYRSRCFIDGAGGFSSGDHHEIYRRLCCPGPSACNRNFPLFLNARSRLQRPTKSFGF